MSQDSPISDATGPAVTPAVPEEQAERVFLVSYPKIVFLYPTVLTSLFCAMVMWAKGDIPQDEVKVGAVTSAPVVMRAGLVTPDAGSLAAGDSAPAAAAPAAIHTYHHNCARIFLAVFALNMVVISFDFPRTTSLTWFFAIATIVIGLWFFLSMNPGLAPKILHGLLSIKPAANASFYMIYTMIMLFLYGWVMISRRFDYWEVKGNELLHHHGFLSNLERFSAPNLRIDKEINDLFEYMLLGAGRLIIHSSNERRAIVLENVLMINSKEDKITKMLGALQVRVRTDNES